MGFDDSLGESSSRLCMWPQYAYIRDNTTRFSFFTGGISTFCYKLSWLRGKKTYISSSSSSGPLCFYVYTFFPPFLFWDTGKRRSTVCLFFNLPFPLITTIPTMTMTPAKILKTQELKSGFGGTADGKQAAQKVAKEQEKA